MCVRVTVGLLSRYIHEILYLRFQRNILFSFDENECVKGQCEVLLLKFNPTRRTDSYDVLRVRTLTRHLNIAIRRV